MPKKEKNKNLEQALAKIEKQFGKGAIMKLGKQKVDESVKFISTGSFSLDKALGVGGVPRGRIVELYGNESSGKTTLALTIIKSVQESGGKGAYIDAEHGLDLDYAKKIGVNTEELLLSQPDYGEQALSIAQALIESGEVDVIIIDSVSALTPKCEIEGDMEDSHIGVQARMMGQAMRKLAGIIHKTNTCVIFINQVRMKIGVMFGCFHYNARVLLENGNTEKIGKIINQKQKVKVVSYNEYNNQIEYKPIQSYYKNGKANQFYQMIVQYPYGSGRSNLPIGDNHIFPTAKGFIEFKNLKVGDKVYIKVPNYLNSEQKELALGMILGDSNLRTKNHMTVSLRTKHSVKQNDYCKWKQSLFPKEFISCCGIDNQKRYWFDSCKTHELFKYKKNKFAKALRIIDKDIIKNISLKSIAIWYLDDGTFSGNYEYWGNGKSRIYCTKLRKSDKKKVIKIFNKLGLFNCKTDAKGFVFYGEDSFNFQKKIVKYIPKCMKYKIHPKLQKFCGIYKYNQVNEIKETIIESPILKIYNKPITRSKFKYDLEVKDNHNYFIDNVLVHNSPETTSGGKALKFYASVRIDLRRRGNIQQGEAYIGAKIKAKVVKNKVAPPFRVGEFFIYFDEGISPSAEIIELAEKHKILTKKGAWYSYKDENIGQGFENTKQYMKDNPKVLKEIEDQLKKMMEG